MVLPVSTPEMMCKGVFVCASSSLRFNQGQDSSSFGNKNSHALLVLLCIPFAATETFIEAIFWVYFLHSIIKAIVWIMSGGDQTIQRREDYP